MGVCFETCTPRVLLDTHTLAVQSTVLSICSSTPPACKCAFRQHSPEGWTGIVIDGCFHIASPQSCIPSFG